MYAYLPTLFQHYFLRQNPSIFFLNSFRNLCFAFIVYFYNMYLYNLTNSSDVYRHCKIYRGECGYRIRINLGKEI